MIEPEQVKFQWAKRSHQIRESVKKYSESAMTYPDADEPITEARLRVIGFIQVDDDDSPIYHFELGRAVIYEHRGAWLFSDDEHEMHNMGDIYKLLVWLRDSGPMEPVE